jgi:hypothetical protein
MDVRFCSLCAAALHPAKRPQARRESSGTTASVGVFTLDEIIRFLNDEQVRATYGAVAELVGGIAQGIGARLGFRRPEASWVVNADTGVPTGYRVDERHSALLSKADIITTGSELDRRLAIWKVRR